MSFPQLKEGQKDEAEAELLQRTRQRFGKDEDLEPLPLCSQIFGDFF